MHLYENSDFLANVQCLCSDQVVPAPHFDRMPGTQKFSGLRFVWGLIEFRDLSFILSGLRIDILQHLYSHLVQTEMRRIGYIELIAFDALRDSSVAHL